MSIQKEMLSTTQDVVAFNPTAISSDTNTDSSIVIDIFNYTALTFRVFCTAYAAGDATPYIKLSNDITFATGVTTLTDADFNVLQDSSPVVNKLGFASAKLSAANELKRFGIVPENKRYLKIGFTTANSADLSVMALLEGQLANVL